MATNTDIDVSRLEPEIKRRIGALENHLSAGDWSALALEVRNLQTLTAAAAELQKRLG